MKKILILLFLLANMLYATVPTKKSVAKLYIATFNRAPDSAGLDYWVKKSGLDLEEISQSFFDQKETKELYPSGYSNEEFINEVYSNLFNRIPDAKGKAYWLDELNSGKIQRSVYILAAVNGTQGDDTVILENKTIVGLAFAKAGMNDINNAKKIMFDITADPKSVEDALKEFGIGSKNSDEEKSDEEDPDTYKPDTDRTGDNGSSPAQKQTVGWYMRTVAKARANDGKEYIHQTAGVFGELNESSNDKDRHDVASYGKGVLQVVFTPKWDENNETYFSDYRAYANGEKQVWIFQVKNQKTENPGTPVNLANADLILSIEGMYDVYKGITRRFDEELSKDDSKKTALTLIDVDNQRTYSYSEVQRAGLTMDGKHVRTFKWVLGSVDAEDMEPLNAEVSTQSANRVSMKRIEDMQSDFSTTRVSGSSKFGLPPE